MELKLVYQTPINVLEVGAIADEMCKPAKHQLVISPRHLARLGIDRQEFPDGLMEGRLRLA
jgi:hypothetical protein